MASLEQYLNSTEKGKSLFENEVRKLKTPVCKVFLIAGKITPVDFKAGGLSVKSKDASKVQAKFPHVVRANGDKILLAAAKKSKNKMKNKRVAVLFSGGPAAGGHNVVAGIFDMLGEDNTLLGIKAGPKGLIKGDLFEVKPEDIKRIKNTGGFDFLGSDRTKIKTPEQFEAVKQTCKKNKLDALVVIGGDDSNTNAAFLAEFLFENIKEDGSGVQVIGVPKTIDGDLQIGKNLPISFGFDTATKVYAEMVGNILQDTPSSRKYWHFVKLMGRAASHVALEVALQTKPAVALVSEEIANKNMSLSQIIDDIAKVVIERSKSGKNYGVVVVPEGIIEFIPEMTKMLKELNKVVAEHESELESKDLAEKRDILSGCLEEDNMKLFASLPEYIQEMMLFDRDAHGNLQVSQIPTEKLLIDMVKKHIKKVAPDVKFATLNHFFGYEGRCGAPSLFDAAYTYNLGLAVGALALSGKTGYIASFTDLDKGGKILAIPLPALLNIEVRHGKEELVIEKALVELDSPAFKYFAKNRERWAATDLFNSPGPRQLWGPSCNQMPITVALNQGYKSLNLKI